MQSITTLLLHTRDLFTGHVRKLYTFTFQYIPTSFTTAPRGIHSCGSDVQKSLLLLCGSATLGSRLHALCVCGHDDDFLFLTYTYSGSIIFEIGSQKDKETRVCNFDVTYQRLTILGLLLASFSAALTE